MSINAYDLVFLLQILFRCLLIQKLQKARETFIFTSEYHINGVVVDWIVLTVQWLLSMPKNTCIDVSCLLGWSYQT